MCFLVTFLNAFAEENANTVELEPVLDDLAPVLLEALPESITISDESCVDLSCRIKNVTVDDINWTKNDGMARRGSRFKASVLSSGVKKFIMYFCCCFQCKYHITVHFY